MESALNDIQPHQREVVLDRHQLDRPDLRDRELDQQGAEMVHVEHSATDHAELAHVVERVEAKTSGLKLKVQNGIPPIRKLNQKAPRV